MCLTSLSYVTGDLTQEKVQREVIDYAIAKFNRLDGLVLNAGVLEPVAKLVDANIADWKKLYDVNFFSIVSLVSTLLNPTKTVSKRYGGCYTSSSSRKRAKGFSASQSFP